MKVILKALVLAVLLESVFPGIGINQETAEAHAAEEEMVTPSRVLCRYHRHARQDIRE